MKTYDRKSIDLETALAVQSLKGVYKAIHDGADLNDMDGYNPIIIAIEYNFSEAAIALIEEGAKVTEEILRILIDRSMQDHFLLIYLLSKNISINQRTLTDYLSKKMVWLRASKDGHI